MKLLCLENPKFKELAHTSVLKDDCIYECKPTSTSSGYYFSTKSGPFDFINATDDYTIGVEAEFTEDTSWTSFTFSNTPNTYGFLKTESNGDLTLMYVTSRQSGSFIFAQGAVPKEWYDTWNSGDTTTVTYTFKDSTGATKTTSATMNVAMPIANLKTFSVTNPTNPLIQTSNGTAVILTLKKNSNPAQEAINSLDGKTRIFVQKQGAK